MHMHKGRRINMDEYHQACSYCGEVYSLIDMSDNKSSDIEKLLDQAQQQLTRIAYELHTANHKLTTLNKIIGRMEETKNK